MKLLMALMTAAAASVHGANNLLQSENLTDPSAWYIFGKKQKCVISAAAGGLEGKALKLNASTDYSGIMTTVKVKHKGPILVSAFVKVISPGNSNGRSSDTAKT